MMVKFYVTQIRLGRITIEDVPERWKHDVAKAMGIVFESADDEEG